MSGMVWDAMGRLSLAMGRLSLAIAYAEDGEPTADEVARVREMYSALEAAIAEAWLPQPRPMTGLWATLTPEQKQAALAYDGPETHGDPSGDTRTVTLGDLVAGALATPKLGQSQGLEAVKRARQQALSKPRVAVVDVSEAMNQMAEADEAARRAQQRGWGMQNAAPLFTPLKVGDRVAVKHRVGDHTHHLGVIEKVGKDSALVRHLGNRFKKWFSLAELEPDCLTPPSSLPPEGER